MPPVTNTVVAMVVLPTVAILVMVHWSATHVVLLPWLEPPAIIQGLLLPRITVLVVPSGLFPMLRLMMRRPFRALALPATIAVGVPLLPLLLLIVVVQLGAFLVLLCSAARPAVAWLRLICILLLLCFLLLCFLLSLQAAQIALYFGVLSRKQWQANGWEQLLETPAHLPSADIAVIDLTLLMKLFSSPDLHHPTI